MDRNKLIERRERKAEEAQEESRWEAERQLDKGREAFARLARDSKPERYWAGGFEFPSAEEAEDFLEDLLED